MGRAGPKKVHRYSQEFKRTAVKLSHLRGVQVQAVAAARDIHPFVLSRWRKEAREGVLRGTVLKIRVDATRVREIKRLQALEQALRLQHLTQEAQREPSPQVVRNTRSELS